MIKPFLFDAVTSITKPWKTPYEKIKALNGWIDKNVLHNDVLKEKFLKGEIKTTIDPDNLNYTKLSDIYVNRCGDCVMRPALFVGMCRILKVPARVLLVFVYYNYRNKTEGLLDGAHGTSEVYDPDRREWIQTPLTGETKE
ncbi:MAG: transglutaminase domain-containing protein [Spirochaetales bacterium]|nr:transglutaminase domain-containing protein [Spirochaetales bacterium]